MNGTRNDLANVGPEQQELGRHGVKHVGRADTTVRVVFLAELQRLSVVVRDELARREALAISQRSK